MPYIVQPMVLEDVEEVGRVERECFAAPWPASAYRRELRENTVSRYIVLRHFPDDSRAVPSGTTPADVDSDPLSQMKRAVSHLLRPFGVRDADSRDLPPILGFAGMWLMFDEAHITTIGVSPRVRGKGLGELLLVHLFDEAGKIGAHRLTLEVRVSNDVAQRLYRKYTFREEGVRKRYYSDNGEDALIMWTERIDRPEFVGMLAESRRRLDQRLMREAPP